MKNKIFKIGFLLAIFVMAGMYSCQKDQVLDERTPVTIRDGNDVFPGIASEPVSDGGVTPYIIEGFEPGAQGGVRYCEDVRIAWDLDESYFNAGESDKWDWKDGYGWEIIKDVEYQLAFPYDGIIVSYDEDTKLLSFSIDQTILPGVCVGAVIVKGGDDANVYFYPDGVKSDSGLGAPISTGNQPAGLSNLSFCLVYCDDNGDECYWEGETAWAFGERYVLKGNWAMYTSYGALKGTDGVILKAGQHFDAGIVKIVSETATHVTITITLNEGFRFAIDPDTGDVVEEVIKIQDYAVKPPDQNPAPGLFDWKFEYGEVIIVPKNNFYGIHVEVEREVCPE
jgi:hypothetical protein